MISNFRSVKMNVNRIIILVFLLLSFVNSFSQEPDPAIDSLKQVIAAQSEDSLKVNSLVELGTLYLVNNPNEAIKYGKQARELAENINFLKGSGYALKLLGLGEVYQGNYLEADVYFKASLAIFEKLSLNDGIANILSNLGSLNFVMGDDTKSIEYHLRSLKVAEEINNKFRIATSLNNIGSVYLNKAATTDKAIDYFLRALPIFQEINYADGIGVASVNI